MITNENKTYDIISNMKQVIEQSEMNDLENLLSLKGKKLKIKTCYLKKILNRNVMKYLVMFQMSLR